MPDPVTRVEIGSFIIDSLPPRIANALGNLDVDRNENHCLETSDLCEGRDCRLTSERITNAARILAQASSADLPQRLTRDEMSGHTWLIRNLILLTNEFAPIANQVGQLPTNHAPHLQLQPNVCFVTRTRFAEYNQYLRIYEESHYLQTTANASLFQSSLWYYLHPTRIQLGYSSVPGLRLNWWQDFLAQPIRELVGYMESIETYFSPLGRRNVVCYGGGDCVGMGGLHFNELPTENLHITDSHGNLLE